MGKVKFSKLKKLRHNPVDLPSAEDVKRAQIPEDIRSETRLPVISQVQLHCFFPNWLYHIALFNKSEGFRGRDEHVLFMSRLLILCLPFKPGCEVNSCSSY